MGAQLLWSLLPSSAAHMGCKHGPTSWHKPQIGDNYNSMLSRMRCALNWRTALWALGEGGGGLWAGQERVDCDTQTASLWRTSRHRYAHTRKHNTCSTWPGAMAWWATLYVSASDLHWPWAGLTLELGCEEEAIAEQWQTSPLYIATLCGTIESHIWFITL